MPWKIQLCYEVQNPKTFSHGQPRQVKTNTTQPFWEKLELKENQICVYLVRDGTAEHKTPDG